MRISALKEWFKKGIDRIIWYISLFSKRFHVELAVMKLMSEVEALKKRRQEELAELGERIMKWRETTEAEVFGDNEEIKDLFKRIEELDRKIDELKTKAKEISTLEE
ncbi:MAG: hypothetical protein GXO97_05255 [Nitrospirae bacterium]|nr:hypothetical protein [Nitrospirota bacterium]